MEKTPKQSHRPSWSPFLHEGFKRQKMGFNEIIEVLNKASDWATKILDSVKNQKVETEATKIVEVISKPAKTIEEIDEENAKTNDIISGLK